jgi:hypothetical protein
MNTLSRRTLTLAAVLAFAMSQGVSAQEPEGVELGPMLRLNSADGTFAFTCLVTVKNPANAQLAVRLLRIENGKSQPAVESVFAWRGSEEAENAVQGQIVLFSQSGEAIDKPGHQYLSLLAGFEGNPIQKTHSAGPLDVNDASRWWSRYGMEEGARQADGAAASVLYAMGSGEGLAFRSLADLIEQSKQQRQSLVVVTLEFGPLK